MTSAVAESFGPYLLVRPDAPGPLTSTWVARESMPGGFTRTCFVKRLNPDRSRDEQLKRAFYEESRVAELLDHRAIPKVLGHGEIMGMPFLATEAPAGLGLDRIMSRARELRQAVPLRACLEIARQVSEALWAGHNLVGPDQRMLELVHKNLSPENVTLTTRGEVKVADFAGGRDDGRIARALGLPPRGHAPYAPPEQLSGHVVDGRADLFALGVMMAELIGGASVYAGAELKISSAEIPDRARELIGSRQEAGFTLIELVGKLTAPNPEARPTTAREVSEVLHKIARHLPKAEDLGALTYHLFTSEEWREVVGSEAARLGLTPMDFVPAPDPVELTPSPEATPAPALGWEGIADPAPVPRAPSSSRALPFDPIPDATQPVAVTPDPDQAPAIPLALPVPPARSASTAGARVAYSVRQQGQHVPVPLIRPDDPAAVIRTNLEEAVKDRKAPPAERTIDVPFIGGAVVAYALLILIARFALAPDPREEIDGAGGTASAAESEDPFAMPNGAGKPLTAERSSARTGLLIVRSSPSEATVVINGRATAKKTPARIGELDTDTLFRVSVHKPGFVAVPESQQVKIPSRVGEAVLEFGMEPAKEIRLETTPEGATVQVNGERIEGRTPAMLPPIRNGSTSRVVVELDGHLPVELNLAGNAETATVARLTLVPAKGVDVDSEPEGASVFVNDMRLGLTPLAQVMVPKSASFTLRVERSGYAPYKAQLRGAKLGASLKIELKELTLEKMALTKEERAQLKELQRALSSAKTGLEGAEAKLRGAEAQLQRVESQPQSFVDVVARAERNVDIARQQVDGYTQKRDQAQEALEALKEAVMARIQEAEQRGDSAP